MPIITLPDGSQREFDTAVSVAEVAADIGPGLAKAALAGKLNGELVDTAYLINSDANLAIITNRDDDGLKVIRHSTAHLLANAVKLLFPTAQVTIGPVIEDGFYYDFSYERAFTPDDLEAIEKKMAELADADISVHRKVLGRDAGSHGDLEYQSADRPSAEVAFGSGESDRSTIVSRYSSNDAFVFPARFSACQTSQAMSSAPMPSENWLSLRPVLRSQATRVDGPTST